MNQVKFKQWLDKQLYTERDEGPVCKLVLRHVDQSGRTGKTEIWSVKIPYSDECVTLPEDEISGIAMEVQSAAFDDAEGIAAGMQRYQCLAYVVHKPHAHSRFTFNMTAGGDDVDDTGLTEPSNKQGLLGQLMRHNEAVMRTAILSANQSHAMMARTIQNQQDHIEKLLEDRRKNFELTEDLKSQKHERDLMSMEAEHREQRYAAMFDKAQILLPALVNRISGRKVLPEHTTPMSEMMKSLAESLTQEQLAAIMPNLKPEQQIALVEFMEASQGDSPKQLTNGKNGTN